MPKINLIYPRWFDVASKKRCRRSLGAWLWFFFSFHRYWLFHWWVTSPHFNVPDDDYLRRGRDHEQAPRR